MFAGLPGIGVGTLFYVLIALWMPIRELVHVARGTSSLARWKVILRQLFYACSIIGSIMLAERALLWMVGHAGPESLSAAYYLNRELITRSPKSILAAPMTASLLVLGGVLFAIELFRVLNGLRQTRRTADTEPERGFAADALNSPPG